MDVILLIILIVSVIAHEAAHGYAADSLGDPTPRLSGRLTMNPIAHIDPVGSIFIPLLLTFTQSPILFGWAKPVPYNPYNLKNQRWGEALVAIAGSATNIVLALIFGFMAHFFTDATMLRLALQIGFVNLFLGLFNLIPFPPLDGFTALRASLPWNLSSSLSRFEAHVRAGGAVSLILFLLIFSYILAVPFYRLVLFLFGLIVGNGI